MIEPSLSSTRARPRTVVAAMVLGYAVALPTALLAFVFFALRQGFDTVGTSATLFLIAFVLLTIGLLVGATLVALRRSTLPLIAVSIVAASGLLGFGIWGLATGGGGLFGPVLLAGLGATLTVALLRSPSARHEVRRHTSD